MRAAVGWKTAVLTAVWLCHVPWATSNSSKTKNYELNDRLSQVSETHFHFQARISHIFRIAAYPDVEIHDVDETWDFILLASDGIWDVLSNDDVVKLCLKKMEKGIPPEQICEEIMTECLSPDLLMTGTDNMTIVLTCFLHNKSYEEFCKRAADYCHRLFPDDEPFQHEPKSENGLSPAEAVIPHEIEEADDSDDEEPNNQNGDAKDDDTPRENGQTDATTDSTQESKKFKEENADEQEDLK